MTRICGSLLVFLLASCLKADDIDWKAEITNLIQLVDKDFEVEKVDEIPKRVYAPDFLRIAPEGIVNGDFAALGHLLKLRRNEFVGSPHIVSICGNTALAWHSISRELGSKTVKGSVVMLYEYTDGKVLAKFAHLTV